MPSRVHAILLAALVGAGACGSGAAMSRSGAGGHGGSAGGSGATDGGSVRVDAGPGPAGAKPDAGATLSCAGATDGGSACVQFDSSYADPASVCAAQGFGSVASGPCALDGSAGGCHVIDGASGYTVWSYAPQTAGAEMFHCEQLGQSYVSASSGVESDAASLLTSGAN